MYLDGNRLECEGVIELIKLFADHAEMESIERADKKEEEKLSSTITNVLAPPPVMMSSISRSNSAVSERYRGVLREDSGKGEGSTVLKQIFTRNNFDNFKFKGLCHKAFFVLGQFFAKIVPDKL